MHIKLHHVRCLPAKSELKMSKNGKSAWYLIIMYIIDSIHITLFELAFECLINKFNVQFRHITVVYLNSNNHTKEIEFHAQGPPFCDNRTNFE